MVGPLEVMILRPVDCLGTDFGQIADFILNEVSIRRSELELLGVLTVGSSLLVTDGNNIFMRIS